MENNSLLLTLLTIFVAVAAIALLAQAAALIGVYLVAKKLQGKVFELWPQINGIVAAVKKTADGAEKHIDSIGNTSVNILGVAKQQLVRVDELLSDASTRAKVQMERAEMVLDDTMTRVQSTVSVVQRGVVRPIREVHGVLTGFRTAIQHLGRGSKSTVDHATSDEEMFI